MKKLIIPFIFLCLAGVTVAQPLTHSFRFRHYSVEDGLSSNSVRSIIQDRKGYIWFGTDNGVDCFDGKQTYNYGRKDGPGNSSVYAMFEDADGLIWIATDNGVYQYHPGQDQFSLFVSVAQDNRPILGIVSNILQDKDMNLWFSSFGEGVFRYNKKQDELTHYVMPDGQKFIYYVYIDSDNSIWAASKSLFKLNKTSNTFETFPLRTKGKDTISNILTLFEDSSNTFWAGTWDTGLKKIDRYTGEVTTYISPESEEGVMHIHSLNEYMYPVLLVGSDDGLSLFNAVTGEHHLFTPDETNPYSLSNQFIYPIVNDREGGLWIGTYYGGVNYVSPQNGQFEGYKHSQYANSVVGNIISRFCEDKKGNIWIAADDGGVSCYSPGTDRFTNYVPQEGKNSLSYHNVHALCFDGDELWIGTYSGGLNVLNTQTGKFRVYNSTNAKNSLDQSSIYDIFKDREGRMWVTTMSGVNLYDREKDHFVRLKDFGYTTINIKQDSQGDIWFATLGKGIFRYNPTKDTWINYLHSEAQGSLPSNTVSSIHIDAHRDMWIGTSKGLCKYEPASDTFNSIHLLPEEPTVYCIIEDQHQLWITTSQGLIHYTPGEECRVFTQSDGLQSDLFIPSSGIKASDGKIYIGSVKGFNAFYPHAIRNNRFIPPVVLTNLEVLNKEVTVSEDGILQAPIDQAQRINLTHRDNVFTLQYAALSYATPEKNAYAYKLEGFDKDWNYVGAQNRATYTSLPAGTYTFRVKASNNDGIWNEEGTSLQIVIHPPFYLSTAFNVFYLLLICLGIVLLARLFIRRTDKKLNVEIAELNRQKENEVHEAKIRFFTTIAHEIRTPVSLIIAPLEKLMASAGIPHNIKEELNVIDRNSQRLLLLVNQLLDFRKVEQEGVRLKLERTNIHDLIKAMSVRFRPWVTQRGASFTVECPQTDMMAIVDKEALTKLISNLLTNASKYTRDEVLLSCRLATDENLLYITVTDNGDGISKEDLSKIFRPFYQTSDNKPGTGIGLSIVHSIVEAHGGTIDVHSEVGKGSSFVVCLPVEPAGYDATASIADESKPENGLPEDILTPDIEPVNVDADKPVMLIVDDNEDMLQFLSDSFVDEYGVLTATDGQEALGILQRNEVNLIISDWMMDGMDGIELCKSIRENQAISHIPFILLTAKSDIHSKIEGMDCGADIYIEKPFSLQYLRSCIKNLLDLREMLYQKFSKMPLVPLKSIAANKADEGFLTRMNGIIEENFSNPDLSVDFLADQLCISRSGLFAKIKTLTNVTPNELIQVVRLKKAAALLTENKYRINEISYMVGFNNPSYFAKCFQKQFGLKPGEFLRKGEKGNEG